MKALLVKALVAISLGLAGLSAAPLTVPAALADVPAAEAGQQVEGETFDLTEFASCDASTDEACRTARPATAAPARTHVHRHRRIRHKHATRR